MTERMIELPEAELTAMAQKVLSLEDELFEIRRDGQTRIDELVGQCDAFREDADVWKRAHGSCSAALRFAAAVAGIGWAMALWFASSVWGWR